MINHACLSQRDDVLIAILTNIIMCQQLAPMSAGVLPEYSLSSADFLSRLLFNRSTIQALITDFTFTSFLKHWNSVRIRWIRMI